MISVTVNTEVPCFGYEKDRLILKTEQMENLTFTIEKELPIKACPEYEWKRTVDKDDRFNVIEWTSLGDLQESSGVYDAILKNIPLWIASNKYD